MPQAKTCEQSVALTNVNSRPCMERHCPPGQSATGISGCDHVSTHSDQGVPVTAHRKPPFLRRRLGKRLRVMRERAGLGLDEAARRLDKSRTALFRIESGENRPDVHVIRSMMDLYD